MVLHTEMVHDLACSIELRMQVDRLHRRARKKRMGLLEAIPESSSRFLRNGSCTAVNQRRRYVTSDVFLTLSFKQHQNLMKQGIEKTAFILLVLILKM